MEAMNSSRSAVAAAAAGIYLPSGNRKAVGGAVAAAPFTWSPPNRSSSRQCQWCGRTVEAARAVKRLRPDAAEDQAVPF